jgi:two-component system phosphate regulon sensor histidine kinase PhoR
MRLGFRGKILLAIFGVASASLLLVATLVSLSLPEQTIRRIETSLVSEARLIGEILEHHERQLAGEGLEAEAARLGTTLPARVTFIRADGTVAADSNVRGAAALAALENHGTRPEVVAARRNGTGSTRRYSSTLHTEMVYVAVRSTHPTVAVVRLSLPLTEVSHQVDAVRRVTLLALVLALVAAASLAWMTSAILGRRLNTIAAAARRYAAGDLSHPVRDYESDELGTVARVLDDTVRQLAGRVVELAEDRARQEAILTGMAEGVLVVNAQGGVERVNQAARDMLALSDSWPQSHYLEVVRHPGIAGLLTSALAGAVPPGLELSSVRGPDRRLVARAVPISAPRGAAAVLVLHDITDLRRADQVRRDFVANVSHELRTPLTAVRGYVEALTDDPSSPEERAKFLEVIARHVHRMERLVRDLLRLASLDARQEPVEVTELPLTVLLEGIVADLAGRIEARHHVVSVAVDPPEALIRTDPAKLQDALRNVLENAVNYSPEGCRIQLSARPDGDRWRIEVTDEGPGIPEADLERIFERFYRVDKARSRESGGTGLGLSIVKHLVGTLGGRVWAENRAEGGARFIIEVPRH